MAMISNDWLPALDQEFHKAYYRDLFTFVKQEYNTHVIYPPADDIFNALHFTPLSEVKVLILGQTVVLGASGSERHSAVASEYLQGITG